MPRTSHSSYPFIIRGGLTSFFYPDKGFIGIFLRRLACNTLWILMYSGNSSRYKYFTYSKILKRPVVYRLNLRFGRSVCQLLRDM